MSTTRRNQENIAQDALLSKILDLDSNPAIEVQMTPEEADKMGAFEETAITYSEAKNSALDVEVSDGE